MTRALNKNKKPESKIKTEHATTFLGSFGSPCSFCHLSPALWRGDLSPLRCEAVVRPKGLTYLKGRYLKSTTALQPNGDKSPHQIALLNSCYEAQP